jgi:hypothetical protein
LLVLLEPGVILVRLDQLEQLVQSLVLLVQQEQRVLLVQLALQGQHQLSLVQLVLLVQQVLLAHRGKLARQDRKVHKVFKDLLV